MTGPALGFCFDREYPPGFVREVATGLEAGGVEQLWIIEDCFFTSAPSLAAAALAVTERLHVGVGILPAVARNAAVTAMEFATLARLGPGRFTAGIGHGVQEWMEQMGARASSPLTALDETIRVVRSLLRSETVDLDGSSVSMTGVALQPAPEVVPPVLAGVRGPRSLAVAGRVADGLVLAEGTGPTALRAALAATGRADDPDFGVVVFTPFRLAADAVEARRAMAPVVVGLLSDRGNPAVDSHPHAEEIRERLVGGGVAAIVDMPVEWWRELCAVGDLDDVLAHVTALHEAGADTVALFPSNEVVQGRVDLDAAVEVRRRLA